MPRLARLTRRIALRQTQDRGGGRASVSLQPMYPAVITMRRLENFLAGRRRNRGRGPLCPGRREVLYQRLYQ